MYELKHYTHDLKSQQIIRYHYTKEMIISWATGNIYLFTYAASERIKIPYQFYFYIDNKLTLNLTFVVLKFYRDLYYCNDEGIQIGQATLCSEGFGSPKYAYCKQYATFSLYPNFNSLCIRQLSYSRGNTSEAFIEVSLRYSVIDYEFVISTNLKYQHKLNNLSIVHLESTYSLHNYICSSGYKVFSFMFKVKKVCRVIFSSTLLEDMHIYDGPGFVFPILKKSNTVLITSTFQCVLLYFVNNSTLSFVDYLYFYVEIVQPLRNFNVHKEITIEFPTTDCLVTICIIKVHSEHSLQINFTIDEISTQERFGGGCLFWGILTSEKIGKTFEESQTICHNNENTPSRSFYSTNSSLHYNIFLLEIS